MVSSTYYVVTLTFLRSAFTEIRVPSSVLGYRESEASQIPGNSNFLSSVLWKL